MIDLTNKAAAYAMALDGDITAEPWQQVRNRQLWRGYIGAIYGAPVATEKGTLFDTRAEAIANARLFRDQCAAIDEARASAGGSA